MTQIIHRLATAKCSSAPYLRLLLSTSALALSAAPALGQDSASDDSDDVIIVTGSALQNQAEIKTRREATAIVDSLSRDEIGALPDITIAESLRRITGVSTVYNDDVGQFASIRGTHPDFVPVTLNGLTLATTGDHGEGTRKVNLQVIPGEAVQQLSAYKTLSPDLDAGALGGLIDISTASAFDSSQSLFNVTVGASYSSYMEVPDDNSFGGDKNSPFGPSLSAVWAPRFGADESWGLVVTGMYEVRPRTQSNSAVTNRLYFNDAGKLTTPISEDWNGFAAPNSFVSHNYTNKFSKFGGTARLEYRPSERISSSLFGFAYFSDEQETRNTNRIYRLDQAQDQTENSGTIRVRNADMQWRYNSFERDQRGLQWLNDIEVGDRGHLSADLGYSYAWYRSWRPFVAFDYEAGTRLTYDLTNESVPFVLDNGNAFLDPANFTTNNHYEDVREATAHVYEGRIDYGFNNHQGDRGFGFAIGGSYRDMDMERDNSAIVYEEGTSLAGYAFIPDFNTPGYSHPALWLDRKRFYDEVVPGVTIDETESDHRTRINDYTYRERVAAAYLNGTFTSDILRLDAGARLDHVNFKADMAQVLDGVLQAKQVRYEGKDTNLLPYVTANLQLAPSLRIKAAASQTLGRPNPETIATVENIDQTELEITRGNPQIQPRKSTNLDLGIEYYFNGGQGMVTLTGFYKMIKDDIVAVSTQEIIDSETYTISQPINGEDTTYKGIEIGLINNSFGNIHHALEGLGASTNFIWTAGSTSYLENGELLKRDQLQYQSDISANAAVFYDLGNGSELRLAMNHQGRYVETFAANSWQDLYIEPFTTFDLTARWAVTPRLQLRLEGRNIFGADRQRNTGLNNEYYRAGLEVGNTWYLRANFRL
ncbi:TonB-dependent receptor [Sneathiella sp.]|uniref:TonB-dependent receptor n=1 Tax=Sneathiella sp. TaxID=1964365 RepID=UPI0035646526